MTSPAAKGWLSFLLVALAVYGSFTIWKVYRANANADVMRREASAVDPSKSLAQALGPVPLEEFTFTNSEGEPFPMQQLAGRVWVASYFFATCSGFCLQMNQEIAKIVRDLADEDVTFVSFTVDPENDTPEELKKYAERMQADPNRWVFLTGKQQDIQTLGEQYLKQPATKTHNDKLVLVGRDGQIHAHDFFSSRDAHDVERLKQRIAEYVAVEQPNSAVAKENSAGDEVPQ
jgi:cytochrome oxidase Cu insertion factor (SCO1/SenC/PrrC family)